jgi:hypothetical protein
MMDSNVRATAYVPSVKKAIRSAKLRLVAESIKVACEMEKRAATKDSGRYAMVT